MMHSLEITAKTGVEINAMLQQQLDAYVLKHPLGSLYHLSAWRLAIESAYGHPPLVVVATLNGVLVGMLPLSVMTIPILGNKLVAMPFADYCDVLADSDEIGEQLLKYTCLLTSDKKFKKAELRQRILTASQNNIEPGSATEVSQPTIAAESQPVKVCMQVTLPPTADQLLTGYKPKLRSQIKKAEKNGLTAELNTSDTALRRFYAIYCENMHRLGSPAHSFKWFEVLVNKLPEHVHYRIATVSLNDKAVGAGLIFFFAQQAWIPWASTLASYNHLAPNMLLYWHIQAFLADNGITNFDMGRSTLGEGTYRFKLQWGAKPVELDWLRFSGAQEQKLTLAAGKGGTLRPVVEKLWQILPLHTATWLGTKIRGYISL